MRAGWGYFPGHVESSRQAAMHPPVQRPSKQSAYRHASAVYHHKPNRTACAHAFVVRRCAVSVAGLHWWSMETRKTDPPFSSDRQRQLGGAAAPPHAGTQTAGLHSTHLPQHTCHLSLCSRCTACTPPGPLGTHSTAYPHNLRTKQSAEPGSAEAGVSRSRRRRR